MTKDSFVINDAAQSHKEYWQSVILPDMKSKIGERNILDMPKLSKIVVYTRIHSRDSKDKAVLQAVMDDLTMLAGQKAIYTLAKKSVSNFKTREGQILGAKVTLRRDKMKSFLFALRDIVLPNQRDFRGLSRKLDGSGGYNMTVFNHEVFPGIDVNKVKSSFKVHVSFVMDNVKSDQEGLELLSSYGLPFIKKRGK